MEAEPALTACSETDAFGVEDARATRLGGEWWINYTAVSPWGIATAVRMLERSHPRERRTSEKPPV